MQALDLEARLRLRGGKMSAGKKKAAQRARLLKFRTEEEEKKRKLAEMEKDTMIQDMMDEFFVKYEMLTFLSDWEMQSTDEDIQTKIVNYIGGTIRENQE